MSFELHHDQQDKANEKPRLTRVDLEIFAHCLTESNKKETGGAPLPSNFTADFTADFNANFDTNFNADFNASPTEALQLVPKETTLPNAQRPTPDAQQLVTDHHPLLARIKQKVQLQRRCRSTVLGGMLFTLLVSVPILTNTITLETGLLPFIVGTVVTLLASAQGMQLHREMTTFASQLPVSDPRIVGPLIDMLGYADMGGIPQRILQDLLPQLQPADAIHFSQRDRERIYSALSDNDTELVLLLLRALEKIGDGRAIPAVTWLASGGGAASHDPLVRDAAQHCLPILEARSLYDAASQTLLRPSNRQPEETDHLLRPAADLHDDGTQLLRPE